jgi:hypothetical protein
VWCGVRSVHHFSAERTSREYTPYSIWKHPAAGS